MTKEKRERGDLESAESQRSMEESEKEANVTKEKSRTTTVVSGIVNISLPFNLLPYLFIKINLCNKRINELY